MRRGCPGGERRGLIRSPLKSLMDGARALHRLPLAPSPGHGLTPKAVARSPSPFPSRPCGLFAAPGVGGEVPPRLWGEVELRWAAPTPASCPPTPGSPAPHSLQARAKGLAAGKRD